MDKKKLEYIAAGALVLVLLALLSGPLKRILFKAPPAAQGHKDVSGLAEKMRPLFDAKKDEAAQAGEPDAPESDRDPFALPSTPVQSPSGISELALSGITTNAKGRPMALINGEMVTAGSKIGGFTVTAISKEKVDLSDGANTYTLTMER